MGRIEANNLADAQGFSIALNGLEDGVAVPRPRSCGGPAPCSKPPCSCSTPCKPSPLPPCKAPPCKPGLV